MEPVPITPQKHDPAWKHCQMFKNGERMQLKCIYCGKMFKGGGIHRIKEHLAGQKGNASTCLCVPNDIRVQMQQSLDGVVVKKRKKQKIEEEVMNITPIASDVHLIANQDVENTEIQLIGVPNAVETNSSLLVNSEDVVDRSIQRRKRGTGKNPTSNSANIDGVSINGTALALCSKKVDNQVHMAIGRFLYDIGAPLDAVNSVYFQQMIAAIVSGGSGVVPPSYHDLRGWVLKDSFEEVRNDIDKCKETWFRTGCSVLVDQWSTETGRTFLSFFAYCPERTVFLKSLDASEIINSWEDLYELLKQVVEEVGVEHVLQVISPGEEQYFVAGRRLADTIPTLYWTPCAARTVDLVLEDFGNLEWISTVIEQARCITSFVYNHSVVLNMVRRYTFGNDIVEPAFSHFATNFATLKQMVDLKHNLQAMVTSQEWMDCLYAKKKGGLEMLDYVSNQTFWSSCELIVRLTIPLLQVLRIVGSNKRPAMGYVYAGIYRAKETIKKELVKREDYMVYWNIMDHRWEQLWHHPLHAAGFYLNPKFFYSIQGDIHSKILSGMFDCIERLVSDTKVQDKIIKEINSYKTAAGDFGRKMAVRARDSLLPAEWWSTYGGGCPNLTRLAIRILTQTCSSMGCKRNKIPFEQIHNTRNYVERQRLSDLVFVHYNLRLREKVGTSKEQDFIDPISFEGISLVEDWVRAKDMYMEDYGNSDWMALDRCSINSMLIRPPKDETEDLGEGFDDYEIFSCMKDGDDDNAGEKVLNH
ncbi:HAT transposon superfamily [Quillaja saponaria]|uniref:HAT transposon superfamily n=1 Tax=Quillaja saponaria TaxID=32244 RepID=A0AAD7PQT6_QUISA|nr:HAT transposon superfamily [Quillaja saponaria]